MNAQPPPLLVEGLPLPRSAELLARLPEDGTAADDPPEYPLPTGAGLGGGVWVTTGTLVGAGAGTDETCEWWETWDTCPPVPDTCD